MLASFRVVDASATVSRDSVPHFADAYPDHAASSATIASRRGLDDADDDVVATARLAVHPGVLRVFRDLLADLGCLESPLTHGGTVPGAGWHGWLRRSPTSRSGVRVGEGVGARGWRSTTRRRPACG